MRGCTTPIGALRHRLVLEKVQAGADGAGGTVTVAVDAGTVWGRIRPLRPSRGGWAGGSPRITHEIVLRSSPLLDGAAALRDGARRFRILGREDDETGRWCIFLTELQP